MRFSWGLFIGLTVQAKATTLTELCSVANIQAALPANGTIDGVYLLPFTVTASAVYNASISASLKKRQSTSSSTSTTYSYCNVTATYTHGNDSVVVWYGFPAPADFQKRFYVGGGGGYSLLADVTGGLEYGAVSGSTDAGYDAFTYSLDEVVLKDDLSINWQNVRMFSYQALGEMAMIGKAMTKSLYGVTDKVYTYFSGCSDGGREGMSQVQNYPQVYDAVAAGAPAFRQGQQQVLHVFSSTVEYTLGYYPPTCALDKIVNLTIAACDPLDGRTDGVISRTDLCMQKFKLNSTIGEPYSCSASNSSSLGYGFSKRGTHSLTKRATTGSTTSYIPAQNGSVTAQDVEVAQTIYDGVFNSAGQRGYLSWQIGSDLGDADPTWNTTTKSWTLFIPSTGGVFVTKFLEQVNLDNLDNLDGVTYDTLVSWMNEGMNKYYDTLQTTKPDLSAFKNAGAKLLHYHGESDPSVPSASSVHYYDSVRTIMYPNQPYNESVASMGSWYRFFQIPGAAHCGTNSLQPGPYPSDIIGTLITWAENNVEPVRLNATVTTGSNYSGEIQMLCPWPLRPYWPDNSSTFVCNYDQTSIDSFTYTFDAYNETVY